MSTYEKDEAGANVQAERENLRALRKVSEKKDSCILFFCKDCQKVVKTRKIGKRYVYSCEECKSKNVAFGTETSIVKFFHLKEGSY